MGAMKQELLRLLEKPPTEDLTYKWLCRSCGCKLEKEAVKIEQDICFNCYSDQQD